MRMNMRGFRANDVLAGLKKRRNGDDIRRHARQNEMSRDAGAEFLFDKFFGVIRVAIISISGRVQGIRLGERRENIRMHAGPIIAREGAGTRKRHRFTGLSMAEFFLYIFCLIH
jgi:hypothetical protein